jgi:hypothetical protein
MEKNVEKAFDFAQDATKQLIGLATGIIALTITFLTDVAKAAPSGAEFFLQAAWVMYLASIAFGVFTLLALTGQLEQGGGDKPSIYSEAVVRFAKGQIISFGAALILTLVFGFLAV